MIVRLEDIPPDGLEVAFEDKAVRPQDLGPQVSAILQAPRASLRLTPKGPMVLGRGQYQAVVSLSCSRCLEESKHPLQGDLDLVFRPESTSWAEEIRLQGEDMDVNFFQNDQIDLAQALREEVGLALPMAPLCRPGCPGLCPSCGKPLSQGDCGCRGRQVDPRLAKLAELKID